LEARIQWPPSARLTILASTASPQWLAQKHQISLAKSDTSWTLANKIKFAWAVVISTQIKSDVVVYGLNVSGRNALVPEINRIAGPTFTTLPFRTRLKPGLSVQEMLSELQEHDTSLMEFEHNGLECISESSSESALACSFQNILTIRLQSIRSPSAILADMVDNEDQDLKFASYPLSIVVQQRGCTREIKAFFDGSILNPCQVQTLLDHFDTLLHQVLQEPESKIMELKSLLSPQWRQVAKINTQTHVQPECLHDVIQTFSMTQPNSEAVCVWDGSLTYKELIALGRSLASHL
jgi:brevianamide F synthase